MKKVLSKAVMKQSQLQSKYHRTFTTENRNKQRKQNTFYSKLCKKARKKFSSNLDIKNITYNKLFWKTMKPLLNDKCTLTSEISLKYKDKLSITIKN